MIDFSLRQLRAFLLVARHRSFSRAAEALFITPSALSVSIRGLEAQLGFRLFDRTTRHVTLTADGQQFHSVAQKNLEQVDMAVSRIGLSATKASQSLSLGATPEVAANILPQAIKEFREHRPELQIQVFEGDPPTIKKRVQAGKLDMGLGAFLKGTAGLRRTPFFRFTLMVIREDKDPAFRPSSTTWSALKGPVLVSLPSSNPTQQLINRRLAQAGGAFERNVVFNYLDTVIAMAEAGEGIAVIPSFAIPSCAHRKVVISQLANPVVNLDFYLITNRGKKLPVGAEDFTSFLKTYIARWAGHAGSFKRALPLKRFALGVRNHTSFHSRSGRRALPPQSSVQPPFRGH
jgi:LysR family carnitine catabolism transcriptional activator